MSEGELLAAGYRAFKPNGHDRFDMLYSRRVTYHTADGDKVFGDDRHKGA